MKYQVNQGQEEKKFMTKWSTFFIQDASYIIQSTYFQYMGNLSEIEYVPATTGELIIDVSNENCERTLHKIVFILAI